MKLTGRNRQGLFDFHIDSGDIRTDGFGTRKKILQIGSTDIVRSFNYRRPPFPGQPESGPISPPITSCATVSRLTVTLCLIGLYRLASIRSDISSLKPKIYNTVWHWMTKHCSDNCFSPATPGLSDDILYIFYIFVKLS